MTIQQILIKYWGHTTFRPLQEEIIQSVLEGKDTLALLPTGGGKSICFQVPALAQEGICIVVSPLISLMKDQVDNLTQRGINAVTIFSGMDKREIDIMLDNCVYGKIKFLYISPERLTTELFRVRLQKMNVSLLAVDEAHCISQWGYDFRPSYLQVAEIRELIPKVPVLALTATATSKVAMDIQEKLLFKKNNSFRKSFERKNLAYVVQYEESKMSRLIKIIEKVKGSGIIYVRSRQKTKEVVNYLKKLRISADYYHAGLTTPVRSSKQQEWLKGAVRIMVATNAFGMGIDKPNVRFVIHLDLPDSLEAYFQEAGRAGRDEKKAYAVLLYNNADIIDIKHKMKDNFPDIDVIKQTYQALGNYFQLAIGSGKDQAFDFDIVDFSNTYNLKPILVYNSIRFLEREGYLVATDSLYIPARIHFSSAKEDLYKFQIAHKHYDSFIKLLLRSYTGLFNDFVKINETEIAKRYEKSKEEVVKLLTQLEQYKLLTYLPQKNSPQLIYSEERLDVNSLHISTEFYQHRLLLAEKRVEAVIHYASSHHKCRSQLLLSYFDEKDNYRCGSCDVCLERNKLELSNLEFEQVSNQIKTLLNQKPCTLTEVVIAIKDSRDDKILKVVQWLMDNEKIIQTDDNLLIWKKE